MGTLGVAGTVWSRDVGTRRGRRPDRPGRTPVAEGMSIETSFWGSRRTGVADLERELTRLRRAQSAHAREQGTTVARASVLNLIVFADREAHARRAARSIAELALRHPSRAIVVLADRGTTRDADGRIEMYCHVPIADGASDSRWHWMDVTSIPPRRCSSSDGSRHDSAGGRSRRLPRRKPAGSSSRSRAATGRGSWCAFVRDSSAALRRETSRAYACRR